MAKAEHIGAVVFTIAVLGLVIGGGTYVYSIYRTDPPAVQARELHREGRRQFNAGNIPGAVDAYTGAIELDPNLHEAYRDRAEALVWAGDHYAAIRDYTIAIESGLGDAETYLARGRAHREVGDFDEAMDDFDEVTRLDPDNREVHGEMGRMLLHAGRYDEAVEQLTKAVDRVPANAQAWRQLGWAHWGLGRYADAIEPFDRAIDEDPYNIHGYFGRGATRLFMRSFEEALPDLERATRTDQPRFTTEYPHLFLFLARSRLGMDDEARQALDEARRVRTPPNFRRGLAGGENWPGPVFDFLLGELDERDLLERIDETGTTPDPRIAAEGYYYIGMKRLIDGDEAGAVEYFRRAVELERYETYEHHGARAELRAMDHEEDAEQP